MSVRRLGRSGIRGGSAAAECSAPGAVSPPVPARRSSDIRRPLQRAASSSRWPHRLRCSTLASRGLQILFELLASVDLGVPAVLSNQLVVRALLDHTPVLQDVHAVRALQRANAVSDDYRRPALVHLLEPLEDGGLG